MLYREVWIDVCFLLLRLTRLISLGLCIFDSSVSLDKSVEPFRLFLEKGCILKLPIALVLDLLLTRHQGEIAKKVAYLVFEAVLALHCLVVLALSRHLLYQVKGG